MIFRTEVNISKCSIEIGYDTPTLLVGSCFTQNIGEKLFSKKIPTLINPFGVVYNPISVGCCIDTISECKYFTYESLCYDNDLWFSYDFHSKFSSSDRAFCLQSINSAIRNGHNFIEKAQVIIITFGTARIYRLKSNGQVVANCHKTPAKYFTQELLSVEQIVDDWKTRLQRLLLINPNIKLIFTVSPIRHWKDGAAENLLSKATLIVAAHRLTTLLSKSVFYFPSYEIMMDDLRDYRFYSDDLLHPSTFAIEYIWEKFQQAYFNRTTVELTSKIEKIQKAVEHRPFNPDTKAYHDFIQQTLSSIKEITLNHPDINFKDEIDALNSRQTTRDE